MWRLNILILISLIILSACYNQINFNESMKKNLNQDNISNIRKAVFEDRFYSSNANVLSGNIEKMLAKHQKFEKNENIKAIIVPHAGYVFSGDVAALAYKQLEGESFNNIFIICNAHAEYFSGIKVDGHDFWETPLGKVQVNFDLVKKITSLEDNISIDNSVNEKDHTLEVQIPFLQKVLKNDFKIVPILFGNNFEEGYKKLSEILSSIIKENDLIVVSSDMSHYPEYEDANRIDKKTLEIIETGDIKGLEEYIDDTMKQKIKNEDTLLCGIDGIKTVLEMRNSLSWSNIEVLQYANSGDVEIGDKSQVVGYGSVIIYDKEIDNVEKKISDDKTLTQSQKSELLSIARETVEKYIKEGEIAEFNIQDERLRWNEGAFVTLYVDGKLRGCIGQIVPSDEYLWQVVREMSIAACSKDHRFKPVSKKELDKMKYEVSVLSSPEKVINWQDIKLGEHGVIVKKGYNSGVFLPQVAIETGWDLDEFLAHLCSDKAGLASDCYKNDSEVELYVFTAQVFSD